MAKNLSGDLQVASANRLADGVVVWLNDAGEWTIRLDRAAIARDSRAGEILLLRALAEAFTVVDPFLVAVTEDDDGSIKGACKQCMREVWIGPRQQEMINAAPCIVMCPTCSVENMEKMGINMDNVHSLGNTHERGN